MPVPAACGDTKESVPSSYILLAGGPLTKEAACGGFMPWSCTLAGTLPCACSHCASDRRWQQHPVLLSDDIFFKFDSPVLTL